MSLDVASLRASFTLVAERAPDLTRRFYEILFARHPELRPMFSPSMRRQEEMLTAALAAVIEHLEQGPWLADTLRALGAKHVGYGVTDEMYPWVADALLATLADVAAEAWTPAVANAWTDALGAVAGLMLEGAHAALAAAARPSTMPASRPAA
jgi:hemoglobin-like flavoprotein